MKKISALVILFSVVALTVTAQKKLYLQQNPRWVEWADTPIVHPVPPEHATQPAVMLLNEVKIDYRVEGGHIVKHSTKHVLIKVLDSRGIARYSTVGIPLKLGTKVPTIRARTISPSGKISVIDKHRILIGMNDEGHYVVVLPMEGVEKNSEIEYLVKEINPNDNFGNEEFQFDIPVAKTRFLLSYRKNMVVEGKAHNGFPDLTPELMNNRLQYKAEINDIPALLKEKNSFYDLHTMAFEYRVSYYNNDNEEKIKLNTYNNLARKLFDENYKLTAKERGAVNEFLSELGVLANGDEMTNIRKIEQGIKKKIVLYPYVGYEERKEVIAARERRSMSVYSAGYEDMRDVVDTILAKRAASYKGYIRLFAACLTQAGVKHEIGWAWDRSEIHIDAAFESWRGLNYTLIYFPNQKKFLSPTAISLRFPIVPEEVAASKGIFCTIPQKGEPNGPLYKVRRITPLPASENRHDLHASVSFTKDMDARVDVSHEWYGMSSAGIRTQLPFVRPENMKKYVNGILELTSNPGEVTSYTFSNDDVSNYYTGKPLTLYASATLSSLVNKAGNRYLVKVGSLIGEQEDIYEERQRIMPVDLQYPHSFRRTITINIPKGYKILNPDAVRLNADYLNGNLDNVISFNADYQLVKDNKNGDKMIITVNESYAQLHFPVFEFERFRQVYNTAADFNNVMLVLVKK
jgi:hypothetical protein